MSHEAIDVFLQELHDAQRAANLAAAQVERCEDLRKVVLSQQIVAAGDVAAAKAEALARCSEPYRAALDTLHAVREAQAEASAKADWMGKRWEKWRSLIATERVKMQQRGD